MANNTGQASVLAPTEAVNGLSQAQLGDEWWRTIYAIPANEHFGLVDDATDRNGRRGSVEKGREAQFNGSVLFIGGAFGDITNNVGTDEVLRLQRTVVLPKEGNATVFLPLLNIAADNLVNDLNNPENLAGNLTVAELKTLIGNLFNLTEQGGLVSNLFASVDGNPVRDPVNYRQASEAPFSYTTPFPIENSLLSSIGSTNDTYLDNANEDPIQLKNLAKGDQVTIGPAVADGYWLAVDVRGGDHTLNFGGTLSSEGVPLFDLDITYNILNPVYGTDGKDNLNGTKGNDYIDGGDGSDQLMGQEGDDLIVGGAGADVIDGGKGNDELWGDAGIDTFIFKPGYGEDIIFDFTKGEKVEIPCLPVPASGKMNNITLPSGVEAVKIDFGNGDILTFVGLQSSDLNIQRGVITFGCGCFKTMALNC